MNSSICKAEQLPIAAFDVVRNPTRPPGEGLVPDVRCRIASALNVSRQTINLKNLRYGYSGLILRSSGIVAGKQFFAKTFLVDPYPIPPRFATPGEEVAAQKQLFRPVDVQLNAEWTAAKQMYSLMGGQEIPTPMGVSVENRTLVFEEVDGIRMDRFVRSRWRSSRAMRAAAAMVQAGKWLRALHDSSLQGSETVDLGEIAVDLDNLFRKMALEDSLYETYAAQTLEFAFQECYPRTALRIPVALNHGDFTLPNLLWCREAWHLWVIDFELSARRPILHDLCTIVFDLRRRLLHPLTSPLVIKELENSFWRGYGVIPKELLVLVNALATARIFYSSLPRISTLRQRRGWVGGMKSVLYKMFFQPLMLERLRTKLIAPLDASNYRATCG